jgi:hypothetical protein
MKRSTPLQRKTPLKSSGFKRKPGAQFSTLANRATALRRTEMKKRARKPKAGDDKKIRDACRDEPCYLRIPGVCTSDPKTSVPAHRNEGKGMGLKTADVFTVPACQTCHHEYDQGKRFEREFKRALWNAAYARWLPARAAKMGLKEEESAGFDSSADGYAMAHASRQEREAVSAGALSADDAVRDEGLSRGAAEVAEHRPAIRGGGRMDSGGSPERYPDLG